MDEEHKRGLLLSKKLMANDGIGWTGRKHATTTAVVKCAVHMWMCGL
jgi:hypothetical protein